MQQQYIGGFPTIIKSGKKDDWAPLRRRIAKGEVIQQAQSIITVGGILNERYNPQRTLGEQLREIVVTVRGEKEFFYSISTQGGILVASKEGEIIHRKEVIREGYERLEWRTNSNISRNTVCVDPSDRVITYSVNLIPAFFIGRSLEREVKEAIRNENMLESTHRLAQIAQFNAVENSRKNRDWVFTYQVSPTEF